jgi:uncharacterized delta-60 repeat protein
MPSTRSRMAMVAVVSAIMVAGAFPRGAAATDGWLDPSFSENGWVRLPSPGTPRDVVVRRGSNDRVLIAAHDPGAKESTVAGIILTPTGAISQAFNGGTWKTFLAEIDSANFAGFFAVGSGGFIGGLWGDFGQSIAIREVGADGGTVRERNESLGGSGERVGRARLLRLPGGSYRTCFRDNATDMDVLVGFTSTLQPDTAVGPDGRRVIDAGCNLVGSDTTGHLYFAPNGPATGSGPLELVRTTTSGTLDATWSGDGRAVVQRGGLVIDLAAEVVNGRFSFSQAVSPMAVLADGSIFLAARVTRDVASNRWSAAVVKLTPDGAMDPSFGSGGVRSFGPEGGQSRLMAMAVDAAGRPVVSVVYDHADGRTRAHLARFTTAGGFDTTFGRGGLIQQTYGARGIAIDGSSRILTAARAGDGVIVARRNG